MHSNYSIGPSHMLPQVVWAGYVWALDVFVARDPEIVLGASLHALYPAFGLPASSPPPPITTWPIPRTPPTPDHLRQGAEGAHKRGGVGALYGNSDDEQEESEDMLPLPALALPRRIRGRHTFTGEAGARRAVSDVSCCTSHGIAHHMFCAAHHMSRMTWVTVVPTTGTTRTKIHFGTPHSPTLLIARHLHGCHTS